MNIEFKPLPYEMDALEPFISARTADLHYNKHHKGYYDKLVKNLRGSQLEDASLEKIVNTSGGMRFNLAAQLWNHDFYWHSLTPQAQTLDPHTPFGRLFSESFSGEGEFRERFSTAAAGEFGSGWAWLCFDPDQSRLQIFSTSDAITPLTGRHVPLLTLDVWEHAYYLDYQNERARYIDAFLEEHVDWESAARRFSEYMTKREAA